MGRLFVQFNANQHMRQYQKRTNRIQLGISGSFTFGSVTTFLLNQPIQAGDN